MARKSAVDPAVVTAAMNGDREAFEEIYLQYRTLVFAVCNRLVKNQAISEELVQDTFLLLLRKIHLFKGRSQFGTWLYQIARNTALMYIRDQQAKDNNESLGQWQEDATKVVQLERVLRVQDSNLRSITDRVTLERLIAKMAPGYRSTLLLHDFHGYEHREICEIMNVRQGTSKSQLHKGRKRLRAMLEAAA
ncbi:sigma-24, ECF subfamily [Candidatus Koribacter versatilis Ellin345]|uniref:Sigma-24, ECF subfamily n=1 Tax=Koribacter versatilis (strain Ellin345) TaxID=204669 RepID=Q1IQP9_KORVE|nr:RNA polymerase sigma factor [Candidatus Koribacter versatilis]ABF40801.1 sigma-24, ECF subfamily [Candidatus Koribacter versatilis Ellin345]